jgi:hypothetical protein
MKIDGVSQTTGVERVLELSQDKRGLLLSIIDRVGGPPPARIVVKASALTAVLVDRPEGPQTLVGMSSTGVVQPMTVEVRGNEVMLTVGRADAAVGLDDLMDAVAGMTPAA